MFSSIDEINKKNNNYFFVKVIHCDFYCEWESEKQLYDKNPKEIIYLEKYWYNKINSSRGSTFLWVCDKIRSIFFSVWTWV